MITNCLGAFGLVRPDALRLVWLLAGVGALVSLWRMRAPRVAWPRPRGATEGLVALAAGGLLALTLARALLAPPNTVDVLNYHLPRQLMWLQQGSLEPFLTLNDRQNMMPPLAEVLGLQFLALTGGDRWANLPQWSAYGGVAIGLALLVRRLGGSRGAATVAALLGLLLPMAYHEASNAKNDLLAAFWTVVGAVELARWRTVEFVATRRAALRLALPFVLAWLTKSTAMLFVPPLLIAGLWPWLRRAVWSERARVLLPAALFTLMMIAPFHARNLAWYGSALGSRRADGGGREATEAFGPRLFASNVLRQASLHVVLPVPAWNERWLAGVRTVHRWLGVDTNDPRTTLWILTFDAPYSPSDETIAGAPVHFVLGLPILLVVAAGWRAGGARDRVRWLATAVLAGAALFCVSLKWQPWATRLEQPLFLLGTAVAVVAVEMGMRRWARPVACGTVVLAGVAWWPGADTVGRTLWRSPRITEMPRDVNYYRMLPRLAFRDRAFVDLIARSGARRIWLQNVHDLAYPLMRRLQARMPDLTFVGATADAFGRVEAIVTLSLGVAMPLYGEFAGRSDWRLVGAGPGDGIYLPATRVWELGWERNMPDFAGWTKHIGLTPAEHDLPGGGRLSVRTIPSGHAQLFYESRGQPMRLRVTARRLAAVSDRWSFSVDALGADVVVDCEGSGVKEIELPLPSEPGAHVIGLRLSPGVAQDTVFTRVQVIDLPQPSLGRRL